MANSEEGLRTSEGREQHLYTGDAEHKGDYLADGATTPYISGAADHSTSDYVPSGHVSQRPIISNQPDTPDSEDDTRSGRRPTREKRKPRRFTDYVC